MARDTVHDDQVAASPAGLPDEVEVAARERVAVHHHHAAAVKGGCGQSRPLYALGLDSCDLGLGWEILVQALSGGRHGAVGAAGTQVVEVAREGHAVGFEQGGPAALSDEAESHAAEERYVGRLGEDRDVAVARFEGVGPQVGDELGREVELPRLGTDGQPLDGGAVQSAAGQEAVVVVKHARHVVEPRHLEPLCQEEGLGLPPAVGRRQRDAAQAHAARRLVVGVVVSVSPHSRQRFGQSVPAAPRVCACGCACSSGPRGHTAGSGGEPCRAVGG